MLDAFTLLSDAQALTATAVSTNSYDSGAAGLDLNGGEPLAIEINVDVAADATTGDETYAFNVIESAVTALTGATTLYTATISRTLLTAGAKFALPLPRTLNPSLRHKGLSYTLGGTTPTITVTAAIKPLNQCESLTIYPDLITIS